MCSFFCLSKGAKAALGEVSPQAQQGAEEQVYLFWHGRVEDVVTADAISVVLIFITIML